MIAERYKNLFKDLDGGSDAPEEAKRKHVSWLVEWDKKQTRLALASKKEGGRFMGVISKATKPLVELVRVSENLTIDNVANSIVNSQSQHLYETYGLHVFGAILDADGHGKAMWGGSPQYAALRMRNRTSLHQQLRDYETMFS